MTVAPEDNPPAPADDTQPAVPPLHTDALLPPSAWPGVRTGYHYDGPALVLLLHFDLSQVSQDEPLPDAAADAATDTPRYMAALLTYGVVAAQLADPQLGATLTQTVLASDGGAVGNSGAIKTALLAFVTQASAQLAGLIPPRHPLAGPFTHMLPIAITPGELAARDDNMFAVSAQLTLSRPAELVDPAVRGSTPQAVSVTMPMAPGLALPDAAAPEEDLQQFASRFEATFLGYDGADGSVRLALAMAPPGTASPAEPPSLWAMRLSRSKGVHVEFDSAAAIAYAMLPLSDSLMNGDISVTHYAADTLAPRDERQAFSGIDLDVWGRAFVTALDEILSPATLAAITAVDGAASLALSDARNVLAQALARGLAPVFPDQPGGQLAPAQQYFMESALASLSGACAASVLLQLPATVTVHGGKLGDAAAPRLRGQVDVLPLAPSQTACSIGDTTLPLVNSATQPGYLHLLVTAAQAQRVASLQLALVYRARLVEHWPDGGAAGVLRFLLQPPDGPLDMALGTLHVPLPGHGLSAPPLLREQRAAPSQAPVADEPGTALRWDYSSTLLHVPQQAQDALWIHTSFPLPRGGARLGAASTPGTAPHLFEALGAFMIAWPQLQPHLASLSQPPAVGQPVFAAVIAALLHHVTGVTASWGALRGAGNHGSLPHAQSPRRDSYLLDFAHAHDHKQLQVYARAPLDDAGRRATGILWPVVNGQRHGAVLPAEDIGPQAGATWFQSNYRYQAPADSADGLDMTWPGLDLATSLSAVSAYQSVRNAHLSASSKEQYPTNPALIYRKTAAFATPVLPLLTVPPHTHAGAPSLQDAFDSALQLCVRATSVAGVPWSISLQVRYRCLADPLAGMCLPIELPVLLMRDLPLASPGGTVPAAPALRQLARQLAVEVQHWHEAQQPDTAQAALLLDLTLFTQVDGAPRAVVLAPEIVITVPAGWWLTP